MYAGLAQALIRRTCVLRGPVWVANERVLHLARVKSHLQDFYHQYAGGASSSRSRRLGASIRPAPQPHISNPLASRDYTRAGHAGAISDCSISSSPKNRMRPSCSTIQTSSAPVSRQSTHFSVLSSTLLDSLKTSTQISVACVDGSPAWCMAGARSGLIQTASGTLMPCEVARAYAGKLSPSGAWQSKRLRRAFCSRE